MNNSKDVKNYLVNYEKEIGRYKKLWRLFGDDASEAEKLFHVDKPKRGSIIIISEEDRTDLRIIYTAGSRQLIGRFIYSLTLFVSHRENHTFDDQLKWTEENFGDVYTVDRNNFWQWIHFTMIPLET